MISHQGVLGPNLSIFGIGTDVVSVHRFARLAKHDEAILIQRLFSDREAEELRGMRCRKDRPRGYASSFAIKESVFKALGTGMVNGMTWRDLEITNIFGDCQLVSMGRTAELFEQLKIVESRISCTSTTQFAKAIAMLLIKEKSL